MDGATDEPHRHGAAEPGVFSSEAAVPLQDQQRCGLGVTVPSRLTPAYRLGEWCLRLQLPLWPLQRARGGPREASHDAPLLTASRS